MKSLLRLPHRIFLEAIRFLISIGFVELSTADIDPYLLPSTTGGLLVRQGLTYSEQVYQLYLFRDRDNIAGAGGGDTIYCLRIHTELCPRQDFAWHQLRTFLFTSLSEVDREYYLKDPAKFHTIPKYYPNKPYWCPYVNYKGPSQEPYSSTSSSLSDSVVFADL